MIATRLVEPGDPPTFALEQLPGPVAGPGEVVVSLRAAALNRRDWWIWTDPASDPLPVTLGSDGAGVVESVGGGVDGVAVGDEVVIDATLGWGDREDEPGEAFDILGSPLDGTFAEQVVVPAANVAPKPARLSWEEAAALSLAGLTAWRAVVTCAEAAPGRSLLITGAGSGVSTFAVQIAAALGAEVWVTSGSEEKLARAAALGAAGGVSYRDPAWPERLVELAGGPLDAAIDSYGGPSWPGALRALRRGGTLVSFGDTGAAEAAIDVSEVYWQWRRIVGTTMGSPREYRALLAHVETASWRPVVDSVFPLAEIDAAARRLDAPERFGKVVLSIPKPS
ncbi:MAG: zinc-binding dehydrogenase [Thermoleophilia bacterium]|nr:zinc-binding dehydrogenase [Thermoleophilia bacterium]